jgi:hypothetical protein
MKNDQWISLIWQLIPILFATALNLFLFFWRKSSVSILLLTISIINMAIQLFTVIYLADYFSTYARHSILNQVALCSMISFYAFWALTPVLWGAHLLLIMYRRTTPNKPLHPTPRGMDEL